MARNTGLLLCLAALFAVALSVAGEQPAEEAKGEATPAADTPRFIQPQIILSTQKAPVFPPAAWDARYTGAVLLEMTVFKDGTVGDVEVVRCSHPKVGFEEAAVEAVKQWRFEPGMEDGEAIDVKTRLKLNFTRVGVGVSAKPQVSAASFTVEPRDIGSAHDSSRGFSTPRSGGDPK